MSDATDGARIDCHVHSKYSPDARGSLSELVKVAQGKGLTGMAVTDHNVLRMADDMRGARFPDFLLVPGIEVSVREGHCLALGVRAPVPDRLTLVETLEKIRAVGGVGVPSHPLRRVHGVKEAAVVAAAPKLRALEVFNARDGKNRSNPKAQDIARRLGLGGTGGSDAHRIFETGNAYAQFEEPVESVDRFLDLLEKRRSWGEGVATPKGKILLQNVKNAWLFARRGFRSI